MLTTQTEVVEVVAVPLLGTTGRAQPQLHYMSISQHETHAVFGARHSKRPDVAKIHQLDPKTPANPCWNSVLHVALEIFIALHILHLASPKSSLNHQCSRILWQCPCDSSLRQRCATISFSFSPYYILQSLQSFQPAQNEHDHFHQQGVLHTPGAASGTADLQMHHLWAYDNIRVICPRESPIHDIIIICSVIYYNALFPKQETKTTVGTCNLYVGSREKNMCTNIHDVYNNSIIQSDLLNYNNNLEPEIKLDICTCFCPAKQLK